MLHRLEIENFFSIKEPQIIDLRADANAPENSHLAEVWPRASERAPKVVAFFGANASGKSTLLRALSFVSWFVNESFSYPRDGALPYQRFHHQDTIDKPTRLAVYFGGPVNPSIITDTSGDFCSYMYEVTFRAEGINNPRVLHEAVRFRPPSSKKYIRLIERHEDGKISNHKTFSLAGFQSALAAVLRPNASVISTLSQLQHPLATALSNAASNIFSNVQAEGAFVSDAQMANHYIMFPDHATQVNSYIDRLDFGIKEVRFENTPSGPVAVFDHLGLSGPLPMSVESHGTKEFLKIFPLLNGALNTGGIAVIDELDSSIHPLLLPEIIDWFYDPKRNHLDAQLWMSCHNPNLFNDLTKEEIFFCEKDVQGRTSIYGLRDVKGVRRDDNFYRKYMGGIYGGVPTFG